MLGDCIGFGYLDGTQHDKLCEGIDHCQYIEISLGTSWKRAQVVYMENVEWDRRLFDRMQKSFLSSGFVFIVKARQAALDIFFHLFSHSKEPVGIAQAM